MIPDAVDHAGRQVAAQTASQPEVARGFRERHKHVVNHVLGCAFVVQQTHRQGQHQVEIFLVNPRQRLFAAPPELPLQSFIFQHRRPLTGSETAVFTMYHVRQTRLVYNGQILLGAKEKAGPALGPAYNSSSPDDYSLALGRLAGSKMFGGNSGSS